VPDPYKVVFEPEAEQAIKDRAQYIELQSSQITSERYVNETYAFGESLGTFPQRKRGSATRKALFVERLLRPCQGIRLTWRSRQEITGGEKVTG
jgi:hypothetical protein